jgi:molybdopterin synthase catalytic subunit
MPRAWLSDSAVDVAAVLGAVHGPGQGATVLFLGTVRRENQGRPVTGIRYEAYPAMAEAVLSAIAAEAEARWPGCSVAAAHRTGELAVGDASVVIAAAAPHRSQAFEASRYAIEEIKRRLPVWKKERYADGREVWLEGAPASAPGGDRV